MPQSQTLQVFLNAPIPVGNRVSVKFFRTDGFFGSSTNEKEPLITDLDTKITYGKPWHFVEVGGAFAVDFKPEIKPELTVEKVLEGVVESCTIITRGGESAANFTLLTIRKERAVGSR